jgi:hypothetical protein
MNKFSRLVIFGLIVFGSFQAAYAQQTATIEGTVVDGNGGVVPSAKVLLVGTDDRKELNRTSTDADGRYSFSNLPPGKYEIAVNLGFMDRTVRKYVEVPSGKTIQANFVFSFEPCSGEGVVGREETITDEIRADIVRALIDMTLGNAKEQVILVPRNINTEWITAVQKSRLSIMTRSEVQALTEKTKNRGYFWVSPMTRRGNCIGVSMVEGWTIKGQEEDANMAGGETVYEFRKIDNRWIGQVLVSWIS